MKTFNELEIVTALSYSFEFDGEQVTLKELLGRLLVKVWVEGEGFSGKRPFGNSGWQYEIIDGLYAIGAIQDEDDGDDMVLACIESLF